MSDTNSTSYTSHTPEFSERAFRDALGHYASSVTVVTAQAGLDAVGSTCQSFFAQSLEPPLVALSFRVESTSLPRFLELGRFCVNVLSGDQYELSSRFAGKGDRWTNTARSATSLGNPKLDGALAWFDCTVEAHVPIGDHAILVGRVGEFGTRDDPQAEPLVFCRGQYRALSNYRPPARVIPFPEVDLDQPPWALLHA